jgi:O-antigen/teichoic acid export membrane protein
MSRIRKLASETAVYGISSVLGRLINFALVPFYVNVFPVGEYGIVIALFTAVVFLNIVFTYGMESSYLKYASGTAGRPRAARVFSTVFWSILFSSILFSLLVVLLRDPLADLINVQRGRFGLMYYVLVIMTLDALTVIPLAELRLQNRPGRFATIKLVNIGVNVGLNLLLVLRFGMGIEAVFIANVAASALQMLLLLPQYRTLLRVHFDRPIWADLMRFGLPFVPGGLAYVLAERSSILFLGKLGKERILAMYGSLLDVTGLAERAAAAVAAVEAQWGAVVDAAELARRSAEAVDLVYGQEIMGIFGGVFKISVAMMLLAQMFRYAWQPFFLQHAEDPDARSLFARVFTLFNATAFGLFLGVSFFALELVSLPIPFTSRTLIPAAYWMALPIIPPALLAYLFQGWYYNFSAGLYIEKQTRYLVHCTAVGGVVSIVLNLLLVPRFGMIGAAWAIAAAFASMAFALFVIVRRVYPVDYEWRKVGGTTLVGMLLFLGWTQWDFLQNPWAEAATLVGFAAALVALGVAPGRLLRRRAMAPIGPPDDPGIHPPVSG